MKYNAIIIKENIVYGYKNTYLDGRFFTKQQPFAYSWLNYLGKYIFLHILTISNKNQIELKKEFKIKYPNTPIFIASDKDVYWKNNVPSNVYKIVDIFYKAHEQILNYTINI